MRWKFESFHRLERFEFILQLNYFMDLERARKAFHYALQQYQYFNTSEVRQPIHTVLIINVYRNIFNILLPLPKK